MKILVVNRNYFITGGPEQYWFRLQQVMPDCEFIPYCVGFPESLETPYRKYFLDPPAGGVYFKDFRLSAWQKARYALEHVYSLKARRSLEALIEDVRPDVAYFLNAVHFTDSIIDACRRFNVPIVWRMSDFHKVCASYHLLRDGRICEACITSGPWQAVRFGCGGNQRSHAVSLVRVTGMALSRLRNAYAHVRYFVTPSEFTRTKLIQGGLPADRVVHVPTFVDLPTVDVVEARDRQQILYVGRLSPEKGVEVLLRAFELLPVHLNARLLLIGDDRSEAARAWKSAFADDRVAFAGFRDTAEILRAFQRSAMFVVPSLSYENLPNVVLEGMAMGCAPVVSRLGSLSEIVQEGATGLLFNAGDAVDLAGRLRTLLEQPELARQLGSQGSLYVRANHDPATHVAALRRLLAVDSGRSPLNSEYPLKSLPP